MVYLNYNSTLYLNKLFLLQLAEDVNIFVPTYPPLGFIIYSPVCILCSSYQNYFFMILFINF